MNQSPVSFVKSGDRVLTLSRPVLPHAARRIATVFPQLIPYEHVDPTLYYASPKPPKRPRKKRKTK